LDEKMAFFRDNVSDHCGVSRMGLPTVRELLAQGVASFQLPTLDPDAEIEIIFHPEYTYWYRYTNPKTGSTDEVRGRSYWSNQTLVGRYGNAETWTS
jgi:hypothetical protein